MVSLSISPRRFTQTIFAVVITLTAMSVSGHFLQFLYGRNRFVEYVRLFNLGEEANIPTWFSSVLLLLSALLLLAIGVVTKSEGGNGRYWMLLSGIFAFLSLDEIAKIHDRTIEQPLVDSLDPRGIWHFPWVIPGWVFVFILAILFFPFLRSLAPKFRKLFMAAASLYLTGALVLEMVSAYLFDFYLDAVLLRGAVATAQEFFEMTGVVVFIFAMLVYFQEQFGSLKITLRKEI